MGKINPGQLVLYATIVLVIFASLFATIFQRTDSILLGVGVFLIGYGFKLSNGYSLLLSSLAIFLSSYLPFGQTSGYLIQGFKEGFSSEDFKDDEDFKNQEDDEEFKNQGDDEEEFKDDEEEGFEEEEFKDDEEEFKDDEEEGFEEEEFRDDEEEGFVSAEFNTLEGFATAGPEKKKKKKRVPPPDNGSRAEMFELGKKYKMPKETDDPEYHLDAGTTFMNAYKQLKPDQISAMTKDTQDLINTQKQLMSTLNTLKPLITDGKQMMDTFQNYFGANGGVGDLSQLAEKFAPKAT